MSLNYLKTHKFEFELATHDDVGDDDDVVDGGNKQQLKNNANKHNTEMHLCLH